MSKVIAYPCFGASARLIRTSWASSESFTGAGYYVERYTDLRYYGGSLGRHGSASIQSHLRSRLIASLSAAGFRQSGQLDRIIGGDSFGDWQRLIGS
jgi:hypothetical protein